MSTNDVSWPRLDQDGVRLRAAALEYVLHGWGVLPGSVWDGRRFTLGHVRTPAPGLVPVLPSGRTFRQSREVWSWWSIAPYSVLTRVGIDFDVVTAPTSLVERVLRVEGGGWAPTLAAGSQAWVLVSTRRPAPSVATRDRVVALPPTRLPGGAVHWLVDPGEVEWCPGEPNAVAKALRATAGGGTNAG